MQALTHPLSIITKLAAGIAFKIAYRMSGPPPTLTVESSRHAHDDSGLGSTCKPRPTPSWPSMSLSSAALMPTCYAPGTQTPLYCTAMGKLFLAHLGAHELDRALSGVELTPRTPHTVATVGALEGGPARDQAGGPRDRRPGVRAGRALRGRADLFARRPANRGGQRDRLFGLEANRRT